MDDRGVAQIIGDVTRADPQSENKLVSAMMNSYPSAARIDIVCKQSQVEFLENLSRITLRPVPDATHYIQIAQMIWKEFIWPVTKLDAAEVGLIVVITF